MMPISRIDKRHDRPFERTVWHGIELEVDHENVGGMVYMMIASVDGSPLPDTYNENPPYVSRACHEVDLDAAGGPVLYMRGVLTRLAQGNKVWAAMVQPVVQGDLF